MTTNYVSPVNSGNNQLGVGQEPSQLENLLSILDENLNRLQQVKNGIERYSHKISNYLEPQKEVESKPEHANSFTDRLSMQLSYFNRLVQDLEKAESHLSRVV